MASLLASILTACIALMLQHATCKADRIVKSKDVVDQINGDPTSSWKADSYGTNEFNLDQFAKSHLGLKFNSRSNFIQPGLRVRKMPRPDLNDLPESFTWADPKKTKCPISHIRDQSNCGSCWAVSTAAAFGDRICIQSKNKIMVNISAQYIASCDSKNYGCGGGYMDLVHDFLRSGVITGGDFESDVGCQPYEIAPCSYSTSGDKMPCSYDSAITPKCRKKTCTNDWYSKEETEKNTFYAKSFKKINAEQSIPAEYNIRKDLYENGPLTLGFIVYEDFRFYKSGIYIPKPNQRALGGHAVKLVGWGMEKGVKYWHIANSWSKKWGENGFFRILRGNNACQIESEAYSAMPDLK